tara:strand:+ start:496 stop:651 length:156 start_codon:yes stop_codon:yes gene_type:complete
MASKGMFNSYNLIQQGIIESAKLMIDKTEAIILAECEDFVRGLLLGHGSKW